MILFSNIQVIFVILTPRGVNDKSLAKSVAPALAHDPDCVLVEDPPRIPLWTSQDLSAILDPSAQIDMDHSSYQMTRTVRALI